MIGEGAVRELERQVARRHGLKTNRAYMGPVSSWVSAKFSKMTAQQKGLASCLITGGFWTRKEQRERGYEVEEECPLCRAAPDSLRHRVLICEAVEEERKEERIRWLDDFRESPESHDKLFLR